jgi:ectoine hydroxylase-related dioxygenase (phytanoyl-CoA dioxygenase family)
MADQKLTEEQVRSYNEEGFLLVEQLVPKELCLEAVEFMETLLRGERKIPTFPHDGNNTNQVFQSHLEEPVVMDLIRHAPIPTALEQLLGCPAKLCQSMFFFHAPPRGEPHQDEFFMAPEPLPLIATWTALQDVTVENGALNVVEGSHLGPIVLSKDVDGRWWEDEAVFDDYYAKVRDVADMSRRKTIPVKTGDVIFFHGRTIHWGNDGLTPDTRRHSIACHFLRSDAVLDQSNNSVFLEPIELDV